MFQQIILVGNLGADPRCAIRPAACRSPAFAWQSTNGGRARRAAPRKDHLVPCYCVAAKQRFSANTQQRPQVMVIGEIENRVHGPTAMATSVHPWKLQPVCAFMGSRGDAGMGGGGYGDEEHAASGSDSATFAANDEDIPFWPNGSPSVCHSEASVSELKNR